MPLISSMNLLSTTVDPQEIYSEGLYAPANPPDSLEVLNGGLDSNNYGDADKTLPIWTTKIGSFAAGFYSGFDTWDFIYANQTFNTDHSDTDERSNLIDRIVHSSLSTSIFLPWDASVVLYGFQAYFRQDAGDVLGESESQHWNMHIDINHIHPDGRQFEPSLYTLIPRSRADQTDLHDAKFAHEEYWPYVTKQHMYTGAKKGNFAITASVWAEIGATSFKAHKEKLLTPTGAVWVLAIR